MEQIDKCIIVSHNIMNTFIYKMLPWMSIVPGPQKFVYYCCYFHLVSLIFPVQFSG